MAVAIFGDRIAKRNGPGFRGLGTHFTEPVSATEAMKRADLDYRVAKVPLFVQPTDEPDGGLHGTVERIPTGQVALVRVQPDGTGWYLGTASERFNVVQNSDLAAMLDPLTTEWPVDTAGSFDSGATVFWSLAAGRYAVLDEEMERYVLLADGKAGNRQLNVALIDIRPVCKNTLAAAERGALLSYQVHHLMADVAKRASWALNLVAQIRTTQAQVAQRYIAMARTVLVQAQVDEILAAAYPEPVLPQAVRIRAGLAPDDLGRDAVKELLTGVEDDKERYERQAERVQGLRVAAAGLLGKHNDEFPATANTAWGAYNAVAETEDWREARSDTYARREALFGERARAKARAYAAANGMSKN